ncbi:unnamed protein product [Calicophoron daubneyi]|uniref:Uncharacterized protein n=1 Tax=Calicophoron daubneyi TaxID=300641 RepID=A0AAV2TJJ8_CALDB
MSNRGRSFGSVSVSQCGMPASCESLTVKRIQELLDREKEATEKVDVENSMYTSFLAKVRRDLEHTSTVAAKSLFIKLFETEPDCVRKLQLHQKCEIAQYAYELLKDNVSRLYWEFADKKRDAEVIIEHCYESVLSLGHFESELRKLVSASTEGVANMHITAEEFERFNRWTIRKKNAQLDELRLANIYTTSLIKQKKRRLRRLCEQEDDRISKMDIQKEVLICHLRRKTINDLSEALMSTKKYVATVNDKFRQVFVGFRFALQFIF